MPREQVRALAQELVDFITNEPKRHEEEQVARQRSGPVLDANARKARLVDEVQKKIDAIIAAEGGETYADQKAVDRNPRDQSEPGPARDPRHRGV
jgi:hypothetical protein